METIEKMNIRLVGLEHAPHPKATNNNTNGIIPSHHLAQTRQPSLSKAFIHIIHWPARDRPVCIDLTIFNPQGALNKFRRHTQKTCNNEPKSSPRTANGYGNGNMGDVAYTHGARYSGC